jgi:hypothetical protein
MAGIREVYEDGSITVALARRIDQEGYARIYPTWVLGLVANGLWMSRIVESVAGGTAIPFGLHVEIVTDGLQFFVRDGDNAWEEGHAFPGGGVALPRFEITGIEEFDSALTLIDRDLWNCAGAEVQRNIRLQWEAGS